MSDKNDKKIVVKENETLGPYVSILFIEIMNHLKLLYLLFDEK